MAATITKALLRALSAGRLPGLSRELNALLAGLESDIAAGGGDGTFDGGIVEHTIVLEPQGADEPPLQLQPTTEPPHDAAHVQIYADSGSGRLVAKLQDDSLTVLGTEPGSPTDGLVVGCHFDEGTGTDAADFSGNGNDGTLSGGGWIFGHLHNSFDFGQGGNGQCHLGALGTFYKTAFTFACWVKKAGAQKDSAIMGSWAFNENGGAMLWIDDSTGNPSLTLGNDFHDYLDLGANLPTGVWTHLAATYDGALASMYVDGILRVTGAFVGNVGDRDDWYIGFQPGQVSNTFDGPIDEVLIYDRALSQEEIRTVMRAT